MQFFLYAHKYDFKKQEEEKVRRHEKHVGQ